jgi:hypothetical protein
MHHGAHIQRHTCVKVRNSCRIYPVQTAFDYNSMTEEHRVETTLEVLFNCVCELLLNPKRLLQIDALNNNPVCVVAVLHGLEYLGVDVLHIFDEHDYLVHISFYEFTTDFGPNGACSSCD